MERLSLWLVVLALAVVFAEPARPDPVDTGGGAQRNFLWHTGDGSVKRLPPEAHEWVWRELPIVEPFDTSYEPRSDYDPMLDNSEAPFNPAPGDRPLQYARWQSYPGAPPDQSRAYCPTNGLTGTLENPVDCYTNRPEVFEIEDREAFPGLDTIFEVGGADGERGPNPDYFLADPDVSVNDLRSLPGYGPGDDPEIPPDPPIPAENIEAYEWALRGLALERDDPAYYTSEINVETDAIIIPNAGGILPPLGLTQEQAREIVYGAGGDPYDPHCVGGYCQEIRDAGQLTTSERQAALSGVANPFRGRETPTYMLRTPTDPALTREEGQRYHILDVAGGVFDPAADCDTGYCTYGADPVDPRLLKYEQILIAAEVDNVLVSNHPPDEGYYGLVPPYSGCPEPCYEAIPPQPRWFGPYPNKHLSRVDAGGHFIGSFGGDFSGIAPRYNTFAVRSAFGAPIKNNLNFIKQIAVPGTPGYDSSSFETTIAYTNLEVTGGMGELPLRPAPDVSNLAVHDPLVAQGLDYPFPDGVAGYERNVDPNTGRPRKAGATGPCENAAGFPASGRMIQAGNSRLEFVEGDPCAAPSGGRSPTNVLDDYARRAEVYSILGIGIDEACLKPGGAAGGPNENRYDASKGSDLDPEDFPSYSCSNFSVDPYSYIYQTQGQWALEGSSVDYALAHHPANQSLFAWICSASKGYFASLTPGACLLNIFGSSGQLVPLEGAGPITPFSENFAVLTAGEIDGPDVMTGGWRLIQQNTKAGTEVKALSAIPVSPLNRDARDGMVTATSSWVARGGNPWSQDNSATLDSTLTTEQKALLGCGPFFGTRCDSGRAGNAVGVIGWSWGEGGGIDLLGAEGSAVTEAMPGTYGTGGVAPRYVPGIGPFVGSGDTWVDTWVTWSGDAQPGTIDFMGSPVCTRYAPESPYADAEGNVRLPGCRGAESATVNPEPSFPVGPFLYPTIDVVFEEHYDSRRDGCPFGRTMTARDGTLYVVQAVNQDGTMDDELNAELEQTCWNSDPNQVSLHSTHRWTAEFDIRDPIDYPGDEAEIINTWPYIGSPESVLGARTLFHPMAGCENALLDLKGDPPWLQSDPGFLCDFRFRDFEADFIEGHAQVFRSEIANWSWNFLMFLAVTSCNNASGGDDLADPDCFDPDWAWDATRCSLSAPHLCRNAQIFLDLTPEPPLTVEIDIEPRSELNFINPFSLGFVRVAILGSDTFDVEDVDVATLAFGRDGASPAFDLTNPWVRLMSYRDVNGDDKTDLLSSYRVAETGIATGDTESCLRGKTLDGRPFEGCDAIVTWLGCGVGVELLFLLPPLMWLRGRRRHRRA